jgi:DNA-binding beta-propeller fold protein YncE
MNKYSFCLNLMALFVLVACGSAVLPTASAPPSTALATTVAPAPTVTVPLPAPTATPASPATSQPTQTQASGLMELVAIIEGDPNPFDQPISMAVDGQGNLYVADSGHDRIQIFDPDGNFLTMWDKQGNGDGEFNFHREVDNFAIGAIAIDAQGNVYVVDTGNYRVQKFDSDGKFLLKWGGEGEADGQFRDPLFVAVDPQGNVYVDDDERDDIQKFDGNGNFLLKWSIPEKGPFDPGELAVDAQGNLYVADFAGNRVLKFDSNGNFLRQWGSQGGEDGQFDHPSGVVVDAQGNVYVSNASAAHSTIRQWVQKFDSEGKFLGKWGSYGTDPGEFKHPYGLGIDSNSDIYVVDTANNRIQKFRPK